MPRTAPQSKKDSGDHDQQSRGARSIGDQRAEIAEPKHTPGPWRVFDGAPSKIEIICGDRTAPNRWPSSGIRVAEIRFKRIGRGNAFGGNEVDAANARLIAAAPELLAQLKIARECIAYCRRAHKDAQSGTGIPVEIFIDEVIAKAEGRS